MNISIYIYADCIRFTIVKLVLAYGSIKYITKKSFDSAFISKENSQPSLSVDDDADDDVIDADTAAHSIYK